MAFACRSRPGAGFSNQVRTLRVSLDVFITLIGGFFTASGDSLEGFGDGPYSSIQLWYKTSVFAPTNAAAMELGQHCNVQGVNAMVTAMVKDYNPTLLLLLQRVTNS